MDIRQWHGPLVRASDWSWRILVVLALAAVVILAGISLAAIVIPALLAVVIVPVGRPLVVRLEQRMPSAMAAALVLLLAVLILFGAGWMMVASIAANWQAMADGLGDAVVAITDWVETQVGALEETQIIEIEENLNDLVGTISGVLIGGATRSVAVLGSFLVGLFLFVVTFYFGLRDWPKFKAWLTQNSRVESQQRAELFMERFDIVLRNYWKGQALIGVFDAVALGLGLWLIGVPLALPIAVLTFVISFIPYVGAVLASAVAVFVALGTNGVGDAAIVLVLCLLIFNTGENLMRPWLVGETIKLPTFVVFIASTVGVLLTGALGAVLAIPVVALTLEAQRIFMGQAEEATDSA